METLERETALRLTLEMWKWMAKTGEHKTDYFIHKRSKTIPLMECFLCEYSVQQVGGRIPLICSYCPYLQKHGHCQRYNSNYNKWALSHANAETKYWAGEIVKELEVLS